MLAVRKDGKKLNIPGADVEEGEPGAVAVGGVRGSGGQDSRLGGAATDPQAGAMAAAIGGRGGGRR